MTDLYLEKVYEARTPEETRTLYDEWATGYDSEVGGNGYATPVRCAQALAAHMTDLGAPILDFGCGTGLSGMAFVEQGFITLDGMDLSDEMLAQAQAKDIYRTLTRIEADAPLPVKPGDYAAIAAVGVIGAGAAPLSVFDALLEALAPGGRLVFSFNDHTLEDPAYEARVKARLDAGDAGLLFEAHGDHLPARGLKSRVYVLERM
ncbi:class I SAM-dependent DNA methyltransferase [Chachezhania antarctica]|uniref:class I SAM-dependent DNA methyltransferase n=1 Tax=Chachezhania antarctica TaxID=2340860 RepID=UPI000EB17BB4|nr:methyltransferase domain-containing protein [Chachezhania antarctica]